MRIISGTMRGRNIKTPTGETTRPTADRVKESVFNIISKRLYNSVVLDMFSGSGNIGIEAISRGSSQCVFIEKDPSSYKILMENIESLGIKDKTMLFNGDSFLTLGLLNKKGMKFDLIFLDPPYFKNLIPKAVESINKYGLLNEGGIIISEYDSTESIDEKIGNLGIYRSEKYGRIKISFWKEVENDV